MAEPILKIQDLRVVYTTDESTVYAVNGVNLELFSGETLGLVGETGAGKTTTALSIMGLLPDKIGKVTGGSITLDGTDVLAATAADMRLLRGSTVSMIFQDPMTSLNPTITVGDQIGEVLYLHRPDISRADLATGVDNILEMVGIPAGRKSDYPHQFSGGQRQRVGIARALALNPRLIVCDEPVSALDVSIQAQVLNLLADLQTEFKLTYLFISHDLSVVRYLSDRVCVMFLGKICEIGNTKDVYEDPKHPYTRFLLEAVPKPDPTIRKEDKNMLIGEIPSPVNPPSGCRFHTRCPYASERCSQEEPLMREVAPGRMAACHLL